VSMTCVAHPFLVEADRLFAPPGRERSQRPTIARLMKGSVLLALEVPRETRERTKRQEFTKN
jgi:hypothetical protein